MRSFFKENSNLKLILKIIVYSAFCLFLCVILFGMYTISVVYEGGGFKDFLSVASSLMAGLGTLALALFAWKAFDTWKMQLKYQKEDLFINEFREEIISLNLGAEVLVKDFITIRDLLNESPHNNDKRDKFVAEWVGMYLEFSLKFTRFGISRERYISLKHAQFTKNDFNDIFEVFTDVQHLNYIVRILSIGAADHVIKHKNENAYNSLIKVMNCENNYFVYFDFVSSAFTIKFEIKSLIEQLLEK